MANQSYLFPEDDEELKQIGLDPYSSIASSSSNSSPNPLVKDFISSKAAPTSMAVDFENDPYMKQYRDEQKGLDDYRQAKLGGDFITNIGQSLSNLSLGANDPKDNSPLFKSMNDQAQEGLKSRESDLDRSRKVMEAIESRKFRESALNSQHQDRLLQRDQMQANRDLMRADRQEREARLSEKQLGEVQDFDKSIDSMKSIVSQLDKNSDWTGPIDGRIPDALIGTKQVAFRAELGRMVDQYRKLITGAGASNQELKRLESRLPQPTDSYENFKAKAENFINEVQRGKQGYLSNLGKLGKDVGEFLPSMNEQTEKAMSPMSSDQFPKQVRKDGHVATVSNASEYAEAQQDGWN